MPLSDTQKLVFVGCGEAMWKGEVLRIDLPLLAPSFRDIQSEIVDLLADVVEDRSNETRTVREAESYLFERTVRGACLYLVVCDLKLVPSRNTLVSDLTPDMLLYLVGPYSNGFLASLRASEEHIVESRRRAESAARKCADREEAKSITEAFQSKLVNALSDWLYAAETNPDTRHEVLLILFSGSSYDLEDIAMACVLLGRNLDSLVRKSIGI